MEGAEQRHLLLEQLESKLLKREVTSGEALLEQALAGGLTFTGDLPYDYEFLLVIAQYVDLGFRNLALLESLVKRFRKPDPERLTLHQFTRSQLVLALVCLTRHRYQQAVLLLRALELLGEGTLGCMDRFLIHFWRGRALRKLGAYEESLSDLLQAKEVSMQMTATKLRAVVLIHESWLVFHSGKQQQAFTMLDEAEKELAMTEHTLSLANIAAARGRFVRSTGDYPRALAYFEKAAALYRERHNAHPSHARALVNAAYVKRLLARSLQPQRGAVATATANRRIRQITQEAVALLEAAASIYSLHQHQSGTGSVLVNLGHLKLESGDLESAEREAKTAYQVAITQHDRVLHVRARILQAYICMEASEEKIEGDTNGLAPHLCAVAFAEEAITLARQTENKRLLASAHITRGLAATDDNLNDWDSARTHAGHAQQMLGEDHDHLRHELNELKSRIAQCHSVETILHRWANGELGSSSFQQIEEQFAEIVIPRVWANLDQNVSRVAEQLSISPKKVRRILRNTRSSSRKATNRSDAGDQIARGPRV